MHNYDMAIADSIQTVEIFSQTLIFMGPCPTHEMYIGYNSTNQIKRDTDQETLVGCLDLLIYTHSHEVRRI